MGTCPPPKINSTADIFCSASNTHRLELVILPVRGWPSITVKGSLEFGVKNRGTWINGQGAYRERICLFICVSGSTVKSQKHLGLRKKNPAVWRVRWFAKQIIFQSQPSPPRRPKGEYFHNKKKSLNFCACQWNIFSNHLH